MTGCPCEYVLGVVCRLKNTRYCLPPTTARTPCQPGQTLRVSERGPLLPQGEKSSEAGRSPSSRRDLAAARLAEERTSVALTTGLR